MQIMWVTMLVTLLAWVPTCLDLLVVVVVVVVVVVDDDDDDFLFVFCNYSYLSFIEYCNRNFVSNLIIIVTNFF